MGEKIFAKSSPIVFAGEQKRRILAFYIHRNEYHVKHELWVNRLPMEAIMLAVALW